MRKVFRQGMKMVATSVANENESDKQEYGGEVISEDTDNGKVYRNSRNKPEIMQLYEPCYEPNWHTKLGKAKEYHRATMKTQERMVTMGKVMYSLAKEQSRTAGETGFGIMNGINEFRQNYRELDVNVFQGEAHLGVLENLVTREVSVRPNELQTVMAGVTRKFSWNELQFMYHCIFQNGPLESEEDFEEMRRGNDVVIALSYRHEGPNRMSWEKFQGVLNRLFNAVQMLKPDCTQIRLWVDAVASRRAAGRKWISKGIIPYTVFPVCVCDRYFATRKNRTWINIETILLA